MVLLYSLFMLMLVLAATAFVFPLRVAYPFFSARFFILIVTMSIFTLGLYQFNGNQTALKNWLHQGAEHYRLQEEVNQLGGFQGIIQKIKTKLANNPEDANGWLILGKLYLENQQISEAKDALSKAYQLKPADQEIKHFYELAQRSGQG